MNSKIRSQSPVHPAWLALAVVAGITMFAGLRVHSAPIAVENRYLLIFDTSLAMKKCLPATKDAVGQLFISMMGRQLNTGDSIGVWTFANEVGAGKFPLQEWQPANAAMIASNIVTFVGDRHHAKTTDFKATLLMLKQVVQDSDRLTVIIFCDGDGQLQGTPYDVAVNALFKQSRSAMQKAKRPFVVVLRSQLGEYVGCKVTTDQAAVDFPAFPPLPEAPVPLQSAPARPLPPPAKLPVGPPLIIIGTKVGTNPPADIPMPAPSAPALKAASQPAKAPAPVVVITNIVTVTNTETNLPAAVSPPVPAKPADAIVPAQKTGLGSGGALAIGAGLLAAAAVLTVWMMRRVRESGQSSLITRSLDQKNDPPSKT